MSGATGRHATASVSTGSRRSTGPRAEAPRTAWVSSPARAVLEIAATASGKELADAIDEGLAGRRFTPRELEDVLARNRPCRGAARLAEILGDPTATAVSRSKREKRLLRLIRDAGLPMPETNVPFGRFEPRLLLAPRGARGRGRRLQLSPRTRCLRERPREGTRRPQRRLDDVALHRRPRAASSRAMVVATVAGALARLRSRRLAVERAGCRRRRGERWRPRRGAPWRPRRAAMSHPRCRRRGSSAAGRRASGRPADRDVDVRALAPARTASSEDRRGRRARTARRRWRIGGAARAWDGGGDRSRLGRAGATDGRGRGARTRGRPILAGQRRLGPVRGPDPRPA